MLERLADLVAAGKSFAFETTLSTRSYLRLIPRWRRSGCRVKLYFLQLPDPEFAIRRVERRVRLGGHPIPADTIRRRFERGPSTLRLSLIPDPRSLGTLPLLFPHAIYDGSQDPPPLLETGDNRPPPRKLMEDPVPFLSSDAKPRLVRPLDDPDFIGAEAVLKRASAKAVARARAAGLEPVVRDPPEQDEAVLRERPVP